MTPFLAAITFAPAAYARALALNPPVPGIAG